MSILMAAERVYSVDAEMADGSRRVVQVEAGTSGEAYRQVRDRPDVRRVGKVTEGVRSTPFDASAAQGRPAADRRPDAARPGSATPHPQQSPDHTVPPADRVKSLGFQLSGPRVVLDSKVKAGERPFAGLALPPDWKPPPPPPPAPPKPVVVAPPPVVAKAPQAAAAPAAEPAPAPAGGAVPIEYRIHKSRRKDGLPYLLQRGTWSQVGTKRTFTVDWEKGFAERPQAEKHQAWLEEMAREAAEAAAHESNQPHG